jgi:hypothetical protein
LAAEKLVGTGTKCQGTTSQLGEKCLFEGVLYQGTSLLVPQTLSSQQRALAPAIFRARKIAFSPSCSIVPEMPQNGCGL